MPEMTWGQMREEAEKQGFTPIPVGTYNAKVDKSQVVSGKTASQIQARFVVLDGPIAGKSTYTRLAPFKNDGEVNGMFYQQLGALGFPKDSPIWTQMEQMEYEQGLQYLAQQILEKPCIMEIDHQNYQGELRDNIKRLKPYGGGPVPGGPVSPGAVPQAVPPQPVAPQPAPTPQPVAPTAPQAPAPQAPVAPQAPQAPAAAPQAPQQPAPAPQTPQAAPETPQPDAAPQQQPVQQPGVPQIPVPPQPTTQPDEAPF